MKYSKSRPKIIASGVLDALATFLYAAISILFIVMGIVLMNTDPSESDGTVEGAMEAGASAIATGLIGVLAIILGIICLCALVFSLVGTIVSLKSVNKSVENLKKSVNQLKVAQGFNYAAAGIFFVGAIYDFTQCGTDTTLIIGACMLLVIAAVRAVSGALKTLAVKDINSEQVEQENISFFADNNYSDNSGM